MYDWCAMRIGIPLFFYGLEVQIHMEFSNKTILFWRIDNLFGASEDVNLFCLFNIIKFFWVTI